MPGLERRLIRYGNSVGLTIPHELAALLDWRAGDNVLFTIEKDGLHIRKPPRTSQT